MKIGQRQFWEGKKDKKGRIKGDFEKKKDGEKDAKRLKNIFF